MAEKVKPETLRQMFPHSFEDIEAEDRFERLLDIVKPDRPKRLVIISTPGTTTDWNRREWMGR